jgi:uncharacterized protein YjbI with pentapeptide repeats
VSKFFRASNKKLVSLAAMAVVAVAIVGGMIVGWDEVKRAAPSFTTPAAAQSLTCPSTTGKGKDFAGQNLENHNFSADPPGYLVGANFTNAKLSGAIFARQDLTNARFESAHMGPSKAPVNFTSATLTNTCFINADLDQTDFAFAAITCADFSGTSLMKATFGPAQNFVTNATCRTKFVGATLDVNLITTDFSGKSNWSKSDFTAANFQNLSPSTFNLRGKDITGAILKQTSFIGIDMTGANLTKVDFTQATLTKAKLDNAALNGAVFKSAQAESATFVCAQAYGNSGGRTLPGDPPCPAAPESIDPLKAADFTSAGLKGTDFTRATMDHAVLAGANLEGATVAKASMVQANLQSTGGSGPASVQFAIFNYVDFTNAQLASVDFKGSRLVEAIFDTTTLSRTNFSNARLSGASFQRAKLQSVYFSAANLQSAKFNGVTIQGPAGEFGADFSCGQLGGANFADSDITATNFGNAVMPAESDCCPAKVPSGKPWCGVVDATQQTYGAVTFPVLKQSVTCPNGSTGLCTGSQWQLSPNWVTPNCNVDRVPQKMWSKPNCDGSPGEIVVFKDDSLKHCILATLPGQTEVLLATAQQIAQVNCPGRGIYDLTGLENFIALTKLDLSNNQLTIFTLSFVSGGKPAPSNLQTLDVSNNQLATLDLIGHPKLLSLSAGNNQLASISLNANAFLVVLDASHNKLDSLDLSIQTSLAYVDLSYNKLTSVLNQFSTNLNQLTGLTYLDLSHNGLTTIGSITKLAWNKRTGAGGRLQSLFLGCNASFKCGDLGVYDGKLYPAASTSLCSSYNTSTGEWTPLSTPLCPP